MPSEYEHSAGKLIKRRQVNPELLVRFVAENVRPERTGVHAKLTVLANETVLGWSNCNVEKDEERVRLANSVHRQLGPAQQVYPQPHLKADLDHFCFGLWEAKLAEFWPQEVPGTLHPQPPDFRCRPWIIDGGSTIVFAPPGRGKSYMQLLIEVCVDAGIDMFWPIRQARTLLINLERSARSVADRLGNVNELLGLDRERKLAIINARGRSLVDVATTAERYIERNRIEVVFVDSISRAGAGDLAANESANRIIDTLNHIAPTWLGLAHTPRSDESHLYGSVHFEAGADVVVQLLSEQAEDGTLGVGLQVVKNNDIGRVPMWIGALGFSDTGLSDVRLARPGEFVEVEGARKMSRIEELRQHLLDMGALPAGQIAHDLGMDRSNVLRMLRQHPDIFVPLPKKGREVPYGVRQQTRWA